jgi:hypothetical protein
LEVAPCSLSDDYKQGADFRNHLKAYCDIFAILESLIAGSWLLFKYALKFPDHTATSLWCSSFPEYFFKPFALRSQNY